MQKKKDKKKTDGEGPQAGRLTTSLCECKQTRAKTLLGVPLRDGRQMEMDDDTLRETKKSHNNKTQNSIKSRRRIEELTNKKATCTREVERCCVCVVFLLLCCCVAFLLFCCVLCARVLCVCVLCCGVCLIECFFNRCIIRL